DRRALRSQIPPTQLVDPSYSAYKERQARAPLPNPTNAVGGSFILSLQGETGARSAPKSHQRSWWILHTQPTRRDRRALRSQIPPTQLVDPSYSAYKERQ